MSDATARVRIGRVRMKEGGADLRILPRPTLPRAAGKLRNWALAATTGEIVPDAFAAAAFYWHPETGQYWVSTTWWSEHHAFPIGILPELAKAQLTADMTHAMAEDRIMRTLGYRPIVPPDEPA